MTINRKQLKTIIEKRMVESLNKEILDLVTNNEGAIDLLEAKMDQLSGDITSDQGHVKLDTSDSLINLLADNIIKKLETTEKESEDAVIKEEVQAIAQTAVSQLKLNLGE